MNGCKKILCILILMITFVMFAAVHASAEETTEALTTTEDTTEALTTTEDTTTTEAPVTTEATTTTEAPVTTEAITTTEAPTTIESSSISYEEQNIYNQQVIITLLLILVISFIAIFTCYMLYKFIIGFIEY